MTLTTRLIHFYCQFRMELFPSSRTSMAEQTLQDMELQEKEAQKD